MRNTNAGLKVVMSRGTQLMLISVFVLRRIFLVGEHTFDDRNIEWKRLGDYEFLHYHILDVDSKNTMADVLFKFDANEKIFCIAILVTTTPWLFKVNTASITPTGR